MSFAASEVAGGGPLHFGDFWQKKMKLYFKRLDFNRNGELTRDDYHGRADRYIELGKLTDERARDVRQAYLRVWDDNFAETAASQKITQQVFIEIFKNKGKEALSRAIKESLRLGFDIVDTNADGVLQLSEFIHFYMAYGFPEDVAKQAFQALDTNQDGLVSWDEYSAAALEFFTSEVDSGSISNLLFGSIA